MNFGDILDSWEAGQKNAAKSKTSSTGGEWRNKKPNAPDKSGASAASGNGSGGEWRNKKPNAPDKSGASAASGNGSGGGSGGSGSGGSNSSGARPHRADEPKVNPMSVWMRKYGVIDKDAEEEKRRQKEMDTDRNYLRALPWEATVDLHGLTQAEATALLDRFISDCSKRGIRKVLIIHGKGNHSDEGPVLSALVRSYIERDYRLGESGHPDKADGGKGATWVIIREQHKGL